MTRNAHRRLPKTDLHCHLDGSLRWETVVALARAAGVRLPDGAPDAFRPWKQAAGCRTLDGFLEMFRVVVPLMRSEAAMKRVAAELIEDCAADGIRYVEVRWSPTICAGPGFTAQDAVEAALKGLAEASARTGVEWRVILCFLRGQSAKDMKETLRLAKKFHEKGVVAVDLAGTEAEPTTPFLPYFEEARDAGLHVTCHAGETSAVGHLEAALDFGVTRIGHGTHLGRYPDLLREAKRRGVCLEVSLSSNWSTGAVDDLKTHPFLVYHRSGIPVTLCTDDRGVFDIDLTGDYRLAARLGATDAELAAFTLAGIRHAFLPLKDRRALERRVRAELETMGLAPAERARGVAA